MAITRTCDGPDCTGKVARIRIDLSIVNTLDHTIDACCNKCATDAFIAKLAEYPDPE